MGQKNNPILLRLASSTKAFDNAWYSDSNYTTFLTTDLSLYNYINNFFKFLKLPSVRFSIQHVPRTTRVYLFFCYPQRSREMKSRLFQLPSSFPVRKKNSLILNTYFRLEARLNTRGNPKLKDRISKNVLHNYFINTMFLKKRVIPNYDNVLQKKLRNPVSSCFPPSYLSHEMKHDGNAMIDFHPTMDSRVTFKNLGKPTSLLLQTRRKLFENVHSLNIDNEFKKNLFTILYLSTRANKYKIQHDFYTHVELRFFLYNMFLTIKMLELKINFFNISEKKSIKNKHLFLFYMLKNLKIQHNLSTVNEKKVSTTLKYKNYLETFLSQFYNFNIQLIPFKSMSEWQSANYFADEVVYFLERRVPFRRLKALLLKQIAENQNIRGLRIVCSGRVGGKSKKAQRAKIESFKWGQTSLHVFSSKIDFAVRTAFTPLGSTGIKIWICYD
jgi:ribosomal protein S3